MIKRFFNWLMNWPDCSHKGNEELPESVEMTDYEMFAAWAYGWPVPASMADKKKAWNSRHGDLLTLQPYGLPGEDIKKMYLLYIEHKSRIRKK